MAKQQTLHTAIVLSGRTDNTLTKLGNDLTILGSQIDGISQRLIDFGKISVQDYTNYDDLMRQTKAVGEFTNAEIKALDEINKKLAQTKTYSDIQAAQAEVFLGQLGLTVSEIETLLPDVLKMAMTGNLELGNSANYLYSTLKSLDLELDYSGTLVDQMAKASAISAADIDTLGDSLTRIGSGLSMFKGGTTEVLAILSAMSEYGEDMRGTQGGTALRNFMLSLAAPTGNRNATVEMLENIGVSMEELDEILEDVDLSAAAAAMKEMGLEVYDSQGNLKSAVDIIRSLRDSLSGLNEEAQFNALSQIFGKRTITTALNLIKLTDEELDKYLYAIAGSEGFAEAMVETMQGGIGGAERSLSAVWTQFKTTTGELMSDEAEWAYERIADFLTAVSNTDETALNTVVSGLAGIATAGPGMLIAGNALRTIGKLISKAGAISLGVTATVTAIAALYGYLDGISEKNKELMADNFGTMELDHESLSAYIQQLSTDFESAYTNVNAYKDALEGAAESYQTASATFSSNILSSMLTGATLTEDDKDGLFALGEEMHRSLLDGIAYSTAASMSYFEALFGGEGVAEGSEEYRNIIDVLNASQQAMLDNANELSEGLRAALTSAFADGTLSEQEYSDILAWFESYNQAMADAASEAKDREEYIAYRKLLHRAETASYEEIQALAQEVSDARDSALARAEEDYQTEYFGLEHDYLRMVNAGEMKPGEMDAALAAVQTRHEAERSQQSAIYDDILLKLFISQIQQSELSGAYSDLSGIAGQYIAGAIGADEATGAFFDQYNDAHLLDFLHTDDTQEQIAKYTDRMIEAFGGYDALQEKIDYYGTHAAKSPEAAETYEQLRTLYAMNQIAYGALWGEDYDVRVYGPWQQEQAQVVMDETPLMQAVEMNDPIKEAQEWRGGAQQDLDDHPGTWMVYTATGGSGRMAALETYAEGGRATEPSIFGEAGAEWAIPEQHTQQTALLLNAARSASGFTWAELIGRSGADAAGGQLIYSPTIITQNAEGVREALSEDKDRLERWYRERQLRERIEVFR